MEQPINYLLSNNKILIQPEKTSVKSKYKKKKCTKCNKRRKPLDESHQICHVLYKLKVFYDYSSKLKNNNGYKNISKYFGITQDPNSQDIMIIMPYYRSANFLKKYGKWTYSNTWSEYCPQGSS
ncbi:hypothetical protein RhiirC2_799905 [Rhizophagus irregularis]|uniref:Uncharacterized protein n=1 Tax=Rhizophagus irregularis TaxID=588596 RepID=A0A2N1M4C5_9GLOM|nr:hypothetical protein RhiirC2_799905 [Rhizophagus irregularis]